MSTRDGGGGSGHLNAQIELLRSILVSYGGHKTRGITEARAPACIAYQAYEDMKISSKEAQRYYWLARGS